MPSFDKNIVIVHTLNMLPLSPSKSFGNAVKYHWLDWLQSLKHFFINVSYHMLVASLTLMALS